MAAVRKALPAHPPASMLHGDAWSGNASFARVTNDAGDSETVPVIYDPAGYFGDREADIAMTRFFGGFPPAFYVGYDEVWPLADGYSSREPMLNLFHALNHLNIFGGGYLRQSKALMAEILRK